MKTLLHHARICTLIAVILSGLPIGYLWIMKQPILPGHWGNLILFGIVCLIIHYFSQRFNRCEK